MKVVGLTGGAASGKSTVLTLLSEMGVPTCSTDALARALLEPHSFWTQRVIDALGPEVEEHPGVLNRWALRKRVFEDAHARRTLEAILHPEISRLCREFINTHKQAPYGVIEIPLLTEVETHIPIDEVWVVELSTDLQKQRLKDRGLDDALLESLLRIQATPEQRRSIAQECIDNNGSIDALKGQVIGLHERLMTNQ